MKKDFKDSKALQDFKGFNSTNIDNDSNTYKGNDKTFPWNISQFHDIHIRLLKVRPHEKAAVEKNWDTTVNYSVCNREIKHWIIEQGGNYGITCTTGFFVLIDADTKEVQEALETGLPLTFRYSTGKPGHYQYCYFLEDSPVPCVPLKDGAYIKGKGGYALGPGSIHPNGVMYGSRDIRDVPVAIVKHNDLMKTLGPFIPLKSNNNAYEGKTAQINPGTVKLDIKALVAILLPYWSNADGRRNDFIMAIAGTIARSGGTEDQTVFIISELARITGKGRDHVAGAKYAFHREGNLKRFTSLDKILSELEVE